MTSLAILMTCFNRRDTTLTCLEKLYAQELPEGTKFKVFLVDDGCSDGTSAAVKKAHPDIHVIKGDGSLYWCNGMRMAWEHAAKKDPDFYLWLNDDSMLLEGAIKRLLVTALKVSGQQVEDGAKKSGIHSNAELDCLNLAPSIIVGSCRDPDTGNHTYGGQRRIGHHPAKMTSVLPQEIPVRCDTFQGNVVLVPRAVYNQVGNMHSFSHAMGDIDYGYRAVNSKCLVVVAPGYSAECRMNLAESISNIHNKSFRERISVLKKRVPPKDYWFFLKSHSGFRAILYFPLIYIRFFLNK